MAFLDIKEAEEAKAKALMKLQAETMLAQIALGQKLTGEQGETLATGLLENLEEAANAY